VLPSLRGRHQAGRWRGLSTAIETLPVWRGATALVQCDWLSWKTGPAVMRFRAYCNWRRPSGPASA